MERIFTLLNLHLLRHITTLDIYEHYNGADIQDVCFASTVASI